LLPSDEQPRDLEPQERRLACLRLAAAGLSLRAIAPRLGCSKSSVGRMLAAGPGGIDLRALYDERKQRGLDELRLREGLSAVGTAAGHASVVPERRLLFRTAGAIEILRRKGDGLLCFQRLAERAQRRRSLEMRSYLGRGS
jgi:transposase